MDYFYLFTGSTPLKNGEPTLFYPFGGPDLLNAQQFFPQCSHFVLIGLEQVGAFPKVAELLRKNQALTFNAVLKGARASQAEIFSRGYIITGRTEKVQATSKLNGNGPLMAYLIERGGNTIGSISPFCIQDDLQLRAETSAYTAPKCDFKSELAGVTIEFKDASGVSKSATYIQSNLGNEAYQGLPGFTKASLLARYLNSTPAFQSRHSGHTFTMLKAASYCMHDTSFFGNIRNFITRFSAGILQDDSGIPFSWFAPDQWTFKFYGDYRRAVDDFNNFLQPKLAKIYYPQGMNGPRNPQIEKLPFNYGYNFWKASLMKIVPNSDSEPQVNAWEAAPQSPPRSARSGKK